MRSVAPLALALTACTASTATTGDVSWSGYVFADPYVSEDLLTGGAFEVLTPDGGCLEGGDGACIVGEESSSTAGYWGVSVPVTTPVALRLSGDGLAPTLWRTDTPARPAQWLNGGLFTRDLAALEAFAADLGPPTATAAPLSSSDRAWLWGSALSPEDWAGATLTLVDGDGAAVPVVALSQSDDGAVSLAGDGPIDLFLATDLAPGAVTLTVEAADGRIATETWPAQAGDLVSAVYFALPAGG